MKKSDAAALVAWSLLFALLVGCSGPEQEPSAAMSAPEKIIQVVTETVIPADLTEYFTLPGSLEAWEDLTISAEIAGPVRKIQVAEGDQVRAGQLLLEIDADSIQSAYDRDLENFQVTKRTFDRYQQLKQEGLVSQQEIDELKNRLAGAAATLKNSKLSLEKSRPLAPVAGVVDRLYVDRGEFIDFGKPLLRLVQVDRLRVIADVPEKDIPFLDVGESVEIVPAIVNDRRVYSVKGTIEHIAFAADPATRTYRCKITIDNRNMLLRPGMIVRARFVRQQLQQVVSAPLYSVLDREGKKLLFVEEDGFARQLEVKTGSSVGDRVVISAGLAPEQKLIIKGQQLLFDGARVKTGGN